MDYLSVEHFLQEQLSQWPEARKRFEGLEEVMTRSIDLGQDENLVLQLNPQRIRSSAAATDAPSIARRACFLCPEQRPPEQLIWPFGNDYHILVNPFPIFPQHLTIVSKAHVPQRLAGRIGDMLHLAQHLKGTTVFYNGAKCGASAPDHFHFQAGSSDLMPLEEEWRHHRRETLWEQEALLIQASVNTQRHYLMLEDNDSERLEQVLQSILEQLQKLQDEKDMVGRQLDDRFPKRENIKIGPVRMEVSNWSVYHPKYRERKVVDDVSLKIHSGEVVGVSGLMGSGRTELARSIFGKSYGASISGQLKLDGKEIDLKNEKAAIANKLAYITEDRKGNGLVLSNPVRVNTTLANLKAVSKNGVIDRDLEYHVADEYRQKLNTKCTSVEQHVSNLSGGNQQKVLLAKWMFAQPDILILDEPTRGIDVGAKYEIYSIINQLVAEGKSVIMISSELPEILGMSDRIYVMNEGRIVSEMNIEDATQEKIMERILRSGRKTNPIETATSSEGA